MLDGVSVEIEDGESLAIVGPSGSGKTTLLSILGLLTYPTHGCVRLDGTEVGSQAGRIARIRSSSFAWVFQTTNALGRRSARDNVALGLLAKGANRSRALSEADRALDSVGLGLIGDRPAFQLSGGELQRMCIARAIAAQPRYLLADEPTGQLDAATSSRVLDALWAAQSPDLTMIIASHDPKVSDRCGRVLRLQDGRVID